MASKLFKNLKIFEVSREQINKVLRRIEDSFNRQESEIQEQLTTFGRYIEETQPDEFSFSATKPNFIVNTDSEGGNEDYSLAVLELVIHMNDEELRVADESLRPGNKNAADRYRVLSVTAGTGVTVVTSEDSEQRLRLTVTGATEDDSNIQVVVQPNEATKQYTYVFRVKKEKAVPKYEIRAALGTALLNDTGYLELQAVKLDDAGLDRNLVSPDTFELQESDGTPLTVANGYGAGSDGYFARVEPGNISQTLYVKLVDTSSGSIVKEITLSNTKDLGYIFSVSPMNMPVLTDFDGSNPDYTGAKCTIKMFDINGTQFTYDGSSPYSTGSFRVENVSSANATLSLNTFANYAEIQVTAITADNAEVTFDLIYTDTTGEYTIPWTIGAFRNKAGEGAYSMRLTTDQQAFKYDPLQNLVNNSVCNLTAITQGLSGTITWSTSPSVTLSGTGSTRTLSAADMGSNEAVVVTAELGGYEDKMTIVKLFDGNGYTVLLSNEHHGISVDSNGLNPDFTNAISDVQAFFGASTLTYDAAGADNTTYDVSGVTATNCTVVESTVGSQRRLTITAISADDAKVELDVDINDGSFSAHKVWTLRKTYDGADGADGADGQDALGNAPVIITFDELADSLPNAAGEWTFEENGVSYNPTNFSDVDRIHFYMDDKNSARFKFYFDYLKDNVSTSNPIELALWVDDSTWTKWRVTAITESSGNYECTVVLLSNVTGDDVINNVYTPISTSVEDNQFRFSIPFPEFDISDTTIGFKNYNGDAVKSSTISIDIPYNYTGTTPDLTDAFADIHFIDKYANTYQYAASIGATDIDKYTIKNVSVLNGTATESTVTNQRRITATAYSGTIEGGDAIYKRYVNMVVSFELWVYRNGAERIVPVTMAMNFYGYIAPYMIGEILGDTNISDLSLGIGGSGKVPFDEVVYFKNMLANVDSGQHKLIAQETKNDYTVTYSPSLNTDDPEDDYTVRIYRVRNGTATQIKTQACAGFQTADIEVTGEDIEEEDYFYVLIVNDEGFAINVYFTGDNTLRIEPD